MQAQAQSHAIGMQEVARPDVTPFGVLVVDPSELVGWGVRAVLGSQAWADRCLHARDLEAAIALVQRYEPLVALVSTTFQDQGAGAVAQRLQAVAPEIRVIIFAAANDTTRCWGHPVGAWGWMEREWETARVVDLVRAVGAGERRLPTKTAPRLTPQQSSVLTLISQGATNREIALQLGLSPNTVKEYAAAVLHRLGARNRAEAVRRAQRWGMIA